MRIPVNPIEREFFYNDIANKCMVSLDERKADYQTLRSFYLFGSGPDEAPAHFNKIFPHIDQLASFLYSAETTRFSISLGASVNREEQAKVPVLTQALNDEWINSNADQIFSQALSWSLCFNSMFIKLVYNKGIHPYVVEPGTVGVLREDSAHTDRQEAICQWYYITKSELYNRLYKHPKREEIVRRVNATEKSSQEMPQGVERLIMSQVNPTMYGNVNLDLGGVSRYRARVAEDLVEMKELYIWNDDIDDYQFVTIASPDVVIYDREIASVYLKGEVPLIQVCPNPQYDYYWGISEVSRLIYLQQMRNKRMSEILDLLNKQVSPPTALVGFMGIPDEKNFALNRAGGLLYTDSPNAKVEQLAPQIPNDLFREIDQIDSMFAEASGIVSVLQGRGESGVRSAGHASQLARMGASRAKRRALVVEDALEKVATMYLKLMRRYEDRSYKDINNVPFIAEQFSNDFVVKVDAHSNSPIFMEDTRQLAFNLFKAQAISKERLIDLLEPPMKQLLKDDLKKQEANAAQQQQAQAPSQVPTPQSSAGPANMPLKQVK